MSKKEEAQMHRLNVYIPVVCCSNCNLYQTIEINHGTRIDSTKCPNCRCQTLNLAKDGRFTEYKSYL